MKAIVLSNDRYHPFAEHMMLSYKAVWPSHPFTFRLPYQRYPQSLSERYQTELELIASPPGIKQTVLTLLSDLSDDEWVYWCIDDKYLVDIDMDAANDCFKWVSELQDKSICGVMFCRCRKLLEPANLYIDNILIRPNGSQYIQRKNFYQIWIPQFLRVKILRDLFSGFPDRPFKAHEMDIFTGQKPSLKVKPFNQQDKMYVSSRNNACFGESTTKGKVTQNCKRSMKQFGISFQGFDISHREMILKGL